jgi:hypothetical protein
MEEIYRYFIQPLLRNKPQGVNFHDWMDEVFCAKDRFITRYHAQSDFVMPGMYCLTPTRLAPGYGKRDVKVGYEVWVRKDLTMPDRIDVEIFAGQGLKNSVYALTRHEFDQISLHLKEVRFRKYKRSKFSYE